MLDQEEFEFVVLAVAQRDNEDPAVESTNEVVQVDQNLQQTQPQGCNDIELI